MAGAAGADADDAADLGPPSTEQKTLHDHIDRAIETCNGFGGATNLPRGEETPTALVLYMKDHPDVGLELDTEPMCGFFTHTYPFMNGRVYPQWKTPPNEKLSTILVDAYPASPPDDPPSPQVPRFVVCESSTLGSPGSSIDFEDVLSYYANFCDEEESVVRGWFGYKLGRTVKGVTRAAETPKSS